MNGADIGAAIAAVLAVVLKLIFDRRDKQKAQDEEINIVPDNPSALRRFRDRMRDKIKNDV
jgi:hypothetical protein